MSEALEEVVAEPREVGNLATAELVFPFKSSPLVVVGIPKMYLPLHGPKILFCYHCQVPFCTLDFAKRAAACCHVCCDHLNVAQAYLYCSFKSNPKMHWYSTSAWEHHSVKHLKDNMPIFPDDPLFLSNSCHPLVMMLFPVPQDKVYLMKKRSESRQRLPNVSLSKNKTPIVTTPALLTPKMEGLRLKFLRTTGFKTSH